MTTADLATERNQNLLFQLIGTLLVIVGSQLMYQGPKFLRFLIVCTLFTVIYSVIYQVLKSDSAQVLFAENIHKEFQSLTLLATPAILSYFVCKVIHQSLATLSTVFRVVIFAAFGYSFTSLILSRSDQFNLRMYHIEIYTSNIPFLSVEQNVAFCVFGSLTVLYGMYQRLTYSLIAVVVTSIVFAVSYFMDIPEFEPIYHTVTTILLSYTQNVEISLKLIIPISGMIACILVGYNIFDSKVIENGICMLFGILLNAFGLITILSGSTNSTLVESIFCFTAILIAMGVTRKVYVMSNKDIKNMVRHKVKKVLIEKFKKKSRKKVGLKQKRNKPVVSKQGDENKQESVAEKQNPESIKAAEQIDTKSNDDGNDAANSNDTAEKKRASDDKSDEASLDSFNSLPSEVDSIGELAKQMEKL